MSPLLSQVLRNSSALLALSLEKEFGFGATTMGLVSSAFSFGAILAILPGTALVDRIGARMVLLGSGAAMALGAGAFSIAENETELFMARFAMGIGAASLTTAAYAILQDGASSERFRLFSSEISFLGRLGAVVATAPLAALIVWLGWRDASGLLAVLVVISTLAVLVSVRKQQRTQARAEESGWSGIFTPFVISRVVGLVALNGATGIVLGLWGAPWLEMKFAMGTNAQGGALALMAAGFALGSLLAVRVFAVLGKATMPIFILLAAALLVMPAMDFVGRIALYPWLLALGVALSPSALLISDVREAVPPKKVIKALGATSMSFSVGVFLYQSLSGVLIDLFPTESSGAHPPEAFHALFLVLAVLLMLALAVYMLAPSPKKPEAAAR
jgi:MFS family permease